MFRWRKRALDFLPAFIGTNVYWSLHAFEFLHPKARKISLIKALVHRALMFCFKTKLDSELYRIKQLLFDNGCPEYVFHSCIKQKLANFAAEKSFGPKKCPVYLKLPWIRNVSSEFENQINKNIISCSYAVKPRVNLQLKP